MIPKYRLYDKQDEAMYEVTRITWDGGAVRSVGANGRTYEFTGGADNWPVMQATGLRDKHGTEIYVGDAFKGYFDCGPGGMAERTGIAYFHTRRGYQWEYWDLASIEIIGNVHQQPEVDGE